MRCCEHQYSNSPLSSIIELSSVTTEVNNGRLLVQLATQNDLEQFHQFLGEQLKSGRSSLTPEASVVAFRTYQREVDELRARIQVGIDQADRGEGRPLDADALRRRIAERIAEAAGR
jgi:hypothetical protein